MSRITQINWISIKNSCPNAFNKFIEWYKIRHNDPNVKPETELGKWRNNKPTDINLEMMIEFFEDYSVFIGVIPVLRSKNKVTYDVVEATDGKPTDKSQLNVNRFEAMILAVKFGFSVLEKRIKKGWKRKIKESYSARHSELINHYEDSKIAPHYEESKHQIEEEEESNNAVNYQSEDSEVLAEDDEYDVPKAQEQDNEEMGEQEKQFTEVVNTLAPEWENYIRQATNNEKPNINKKSNEE